MTCPCESSGQESSFSLFNIFSIRRWTLDVECWTFNSFFTPFPLFSPSNFSHFLTTSYSPPPTLHLSSCRVGLWPTRSFCFSLAPHFSEGTTIHIYFFLTVSTVFYHLPLSIFVHIVRVCPASAFRSCSAQFFFIQYFFDSTLDVPLFFHSFPTFYFCNRSRNFSSPDPGGVITIIAAGVGHRPKPVVKFIKNLQPCRG